MISPVSPAPNAAGPVAAAVLLVAGAAVAAGVGAGVLGVKLLLVVGALGVAAIVVRRPFVGILFLMATIPTENILNVGGVGVGRAIGLAVFGAWFLQKIANRQSWRRVVSSSFFAPAVGFMAWVLASMLWAEHRPVVRSGFIRLAQMVALAFIVIDLVDSRKKLDLMAKTLVLGALAAAGVTVYQYEILGLRRAGGDIAGGINATAILLVTVIPVAFYLIRSRGSVFWSSIGTVYLGIASIAVVTTFSRLNLLLLPPVIGLLYWLTWRDGRARGWLAAVTVAGVVGGAFFIPWEKLKERADTIDVYLDQTMRFGQEQSTTSARGYHMRIGLAIARDHPIVGVGYGNYGYFFRDEYQFQVSGAEKIYGSVRSPHSAYIGIAADLGVVGLALWVALLGLCAASGFKAWRYAKAGRLGDLIPLTEALLVMVGLNVFAYGFYTPHQNDKLLWMILAMCVAARYVATSEIQSLPSSPSLVVTGPEPLPTGQERGSLLHHGG